ncbi:MAG: stage II sporulation protein R [Firmicutes bacterium]|nr:stage II sporulation protein R [Bacillota bacterium]
MKKVILAVLLGLILTIYVSHFSESVQADLAHNLVRFHVIANSDSAEDQALKLRVRNRVIHDTEHLFDASENIGQTKVIIEKNIPRIETIAKDELKKWGREDQVKVSLGTYPFPTKQYGDVILPAGHYQALQVVIGEGRGANWWCVLFPPLCFVDATQGVLPESSKQHLKSILTEEEYEMITTANTEGEIPVVIKFKLVEWWQNSKIKVQTAFNGMDKASEN